MSLPPAFDGSLSSLAFTGSATQLAEALKTAHSAAPTAIDSDGRSLTHWASAGGHLDSVTLLVNTFSASVDTADGDGMTPLHSASAAGRKFKLVRCAPYRLCSRSRHRITRLV